MLKKGFTLVELLAVIVILAVIALITTPIIIDSLNTSKKEAFKDSVNSLIKVTQNYYAGITYNDEGLLPVIIIKFQPLKELIKVITVKQYLKIS